tara:strand:+ start:3531 stop:4139 length:609 start_codon:yes stop_codon:yes gene_type:complete
MLKTDENLYTLTRLEFAKTIGKSKNAVKLDMKRGKYKDLYIFKNGQYYFKTKEAVRENIGPTPVYPTPVKRKINRGNHDKPGAYASSTMKRVPPQFRTHNHLKKMVALRGKLSPEELALIPKLEAEAKAQRQKDLHNTLRERRDPLGVNLKSYSSGLFSCGSNKGYGTPGYLGGNYTDNRSYKTTKRGKDTSTREGWGPYYW